MSAVLPVAPGMVEALQKRGGLREWLERVARRNRDLHAYRPGDVWPVCGAPLRRPRGPLVAPAGADRCADCLEQLAQARKEAS